MKWNTRRTARAVGRRLALPLVCAVGLWLTACEDTNESFDHAPPPGQGTLVVDNNTPDDMAVYVDGLSVASIGDNSESYTDLAPGVHRVVLDGEHDRTFADDVDILEGRISILRVGLDGSDRGGYDVRLDLQ